MPTKRFHDPSYFVQTWKKTEVMKHVLEAADRGEFLYLAQLNRLISWGPIQLQSLTSIVKSLQAYNFVKRMYGRNIGDELIEYKPEMVRRDIVGMKQFIVPTAAAYTVFRPSRKPIE